MAKPSKQYIKNQIDGFKCKLHEQFGAALHFYPTSLELRNSLSEVLNTQDYKNLPQYAKERIKECRDNIIRRIAEEHTIKLYPTKRGYIYGYENLLDEEKSSPLQITKFYWLSEHKTVDENGVITIVRIPTNNLYIG